MKKKTLFFIFAGLLLSLFIPGIQAQVTITFHQPPPNQWKMEYMWDLTISNSYKKDTNVYLTGTLEEKTQGLIAKATSKKYYKAKKGSHVLLVNELEPINKDYSNSKYEDYIGKTGTLPDGTYIICVAVYSPSGKELFKDCFEQVIANMSPPELTYPEDRKTVDDKLPVFQWSPPMPATTGEIITYSIKIVELLDGQVPTEAMGANPFYFQEGISFPYFKYPVKAKSFNSGKSYAWQVTAYGKNNVVGKSQVYSFAYGKSQCHTETGNVKVECNGTDNYGNPKYKVTVEFSNLNNDPNCITYLCFPSPVGSNSNIPTPGCNYFTFVQGICTISDILPLGGTTLPVGSTNITFNMTDPISLPIKIDVQSGSICNGSGSQCAPSFIIDTLPPCQCNDCKEMVVTFDNFNTAPFGNSGYQYNIMGSININKPIYALECQVQSYKFTATPANCSNGVTSVEQSGMFLRPSTSLNGITALEWFNETKSGLSNSNNNAAKAIKLFGTAPITGAIPVNFIVGLPGPITGLPPESCKMEYTVCVKVIVFYDAEKCKSCTFIHCFDFTNQ